MKFSAETYTRMFNTLLSQELMYCASAASEHNIMCAIKRVLGSSIRNDVITRYSDLYLDSYLSVHFMLYDLDGEVIPISLTYGE